MTILMTVLLWLFRVFVCFAGMVMLVEAIRWALLFPSVFNFVCVFGMIGLLCAYLSNE